MVAEQDQKDLVKIQNLVKQFPVIKSFLLHKLGNIACALNGFLELLEKPDTTEAQRQKYIANAKLSSERIFTLLRECGIEHEIKRATEGEKQ